MMSVLDSSFLIDILRNEPSAVAMLRRIDGAGTMLIPAPAIMELWAGALRSNASEEGKQQVERLASSMTVVDFDAVAAKRAAELKHSLRRETIDVEDFMIAGIALSRGEDVVTKDAHYARIPGLRVLKY